MGNFVKHGPCPRCGSKDNLAIYDDDSCYCFGCRYTVLSDDEKEARGVNAFNWFDGMEDLMAKREKLTKEEVEKIKDQTGEYGKLSRSISDDTYKKYRIRFGYDEETGDVVSHYYPYTEEYQASGYKLRKLPKDFSVVGKVSSDSDLFGQVFFRNASGKFVILCAGEIDTLSAYQMLHANKNEKFDDIPCVSAGTGENGSHKNIAKHYSWFDRFERVVVIYDQDATGKEAVKNLVKVLPKGKMFVVDLPAKDVNVMLEQGRQQEFINAFWKQRKYTPDGIIGSSSLSSKILEYAVVPKIPLPPFMHRVQALMAGGIPLGVILCLGSASGSGKSTFTDEMLYYWIYNSPHKVGVVSMESESGAYATKLLSRRVGRKIDLIESIEDKVAFLNSPEVQAAQNDLFEDEYGNDRFYLIEDRDMGWEAMKEAIGNLVVSCEVKVVVLDPWQDCISGMNLEQQEKAASWLKGFVKSHNITFILIQHVRKNSGGAKANSQGADLTEEDFHGSSTIFKSSACNLLFMRNKEAEDEIERNTTTLKISKCRWTGQTSPFAGRFYYDNKTHTLHDFEEWQATQPCSF